MRKRVYTMVEIKKAVSKMDGEKVDLKIHLGRNRFKGYSGTIQNIYNAVFTVVSTDNTTKVFSYFDVACGDVVFISAN